MPALPRRNHLVWLQAAAWRELSRGVQQDREALEILGHWHARNLPLVVSRQPEDLARERLAVGLPAPLRWSRRRLALDVPLDAVERSSSFPGLRQVALHYDWPRCALALADALESVGASCHVYGSYGWQYLTAETYLREQSDIDLCVEVADLPVAQVAVRCLQAAVLHRQLDGELVFPSGAAVAWREFAQLMAGQVREVLVKSLQAPRLATLDELRCMVVSPDVVETPPSA